MMKLLLRMMIFLWLIVENQSLVVYKSLEPIDAKEPLAGLTFDPKSALKATDFSTGISFCGRFNYRKLGWQSFMVASSNPHLLVRLSMGGQSTFLFFGNMNWIVKDLEKDKFLIWSTTRWHHICLSFDRINSHLQFFKVILQSLLYF